MAPPTHLLACLLLLAAATGPATAGRPLPQRSLQQAGSPESSAAAPSYEQEAQPLGVLGGPGYTSGGAAAAPAAETPSSPNRFADVGSASAGAVQAAIAAGDAAGFASAAAAAGPEAAGRCAQSGREAGCR